MLFAPRPIGTTPLDDGTLAADKKACRRIGPCGVGERAIYLSGFAADRCFYTTYDDVARIFKRVAMSRGGFTGKGVFGSIPYLVVQLKDGREKQSQFKDEELVDRFLRVIEREHPEIPTHSEAAERRLREAEEAERARLLQELSPEAEAAVNELRAAQAELARRRELSDALAFAAKQKRSIDGVSPTYRYAAAAVLLLAILATLLGVYRAIAGRDYAEWFVLFGMAAIFLVISSRILPTGRRHQRFAQRQWDAALDDMRAYLRDAPAFPVPPQYAHPVVLERMIRALREGRAVSVGEAYETVKADLKVLNAGVTVTQKEYDEVVEVKPLFLVCGYADDIAKKDGAESTTGGCFAMKGKKLTPVMYCHLAAMALLAVVNAVTAIRLFAGFVTPDFWLYAGERYVFAYSLAGMNALNALSFVYGILYIWEGYTKKASGHYKIFMLLAAFASVLGAVAVESTQGIGPALILSILRAVILLVLTFGENLGKRNTWILFGAMLLLDLVFGFFFSPDPRAASFRVVSSLDRLLGDGTVSLAIRGKYADKDRRGTV